MFWLTDQMCEYEALRQILVFVFFSQKHDWPKSVNHISDQGFKYLSGSFISTDNSEYVAQFPFASVSKFLTIWKTSFEFP